MTDPVKRPAPISERWKLPVEDGRAVIAKVDGDWTVCWGRTEYEDHTTFSEAIAFARDSPEIGACS